MDLGILPTRVFICSNTMNEKKNKAHVKIKGTYISFSRRGPGPGLYKSVVRTPILLLMERRLDRGHSGKTVLKVGQMPGDVTGSSKGMESRALLGAPEEVEGQHACGGPLRLPQKRYLRPILY